MENDNFVQLLFESNGNNILYGFNKIGQSSQEKILLPENYKNSLPIHVFNTILWLRIDSFGIYLWNYESKKELNIFKSELFPKLSEIFYKNSFNQFVNDCIIDENYLLRIYSYSNDLIIQFCKINDIHDKIHDIFYIRLSKLDYQNHSSASIIYLSKLDMNYDGIKPEEYLNQTILNDLQNIQQESVEKQNIPIELNEKNIKIDLKRKQKNNVFIKDNYFYYDKLESELYQLTLI
jgi:hypothetical protein